MGGSIGVRGNKTGTPGPPTKSIYDRDSGVLRRGRLRQAVLFGIEEAAKRRSSSRSSSGSVAPVT